MQNDLEKERQYDKRTVRQAKYYTILIGKLYEDMFSIKASFSLKYLVPRPWAILFSKPVATFPLHIVNLKFSNERGDANTYK